MARRAADAPLESGQRRPARDLGSGCRQRPPAPLLDEDDENDEDEQDESKRAPQQGGEPLARTARAGA